MAMEANEKQGVLDKLGISSVLFDLFKPLTSEVEAERINGSVKLLEYLATLKDTEKDQKDFDYCLKRLIRGVGASTTASRAGFFTTLTGMFKILSEDSLDIGKVFSLIKKQLHVGKTVIKKEDADAVVGKILTCGALIRSKKILTASEEHLTKCVQILLSASKHRSYHCSLAYSFVIELLNEVTESQFQSSILPLLQAEINVPWENQTIDTVHCWIVISTKFPTIINKSYLRSSQIGDTKILNPKSYAHLQRLFLEITSVSMVAHPVFEIFGPLIAKSKNLKDFWATNINQSLSQATRVKEVAAVKILTDILGHLDTSKTNISDLLTPNFVKMMVASLKSIKAKKNETFKAFYDDLFEALCQSSATVESDDEKVAIIHKLILHPGILAIEKYTNNRIIHQMITNLGCDGVKMLFETYKEIFLDKKVKDPSDTSVTWLKVERQNAAFLLQNLLGHKNVQTSYDWREEQLKFLMVISLFHFDESLEVVSKSKASEAIGSDFENQVKNIFYSCLQSKVPKLLEERNILISLVEFCDEVLKRKNHNKFLKNSVDEKLQKSWNEMFKQVKSIKDNKSNNKLQMVFQILLLHMGLQIFREPEMAESAILDLEKCLERINQKQGSTKKKLKSEGIDEDEPEWIEVVIDLFLHLLSQNASTLRNVVNTVFPHLCENLTLTAVHQILSVLDMKDGKNPLSEMDEDNDELNNDEETSEESDVDEPDEGDSEDDKSESESEDESLMDEEEEEPTITDKLRNAVSIALSGGGSAVDDDQVSIDLDDLDEEEGNRLDEALANAFKMMKQAKQSKKSKGYRVQKTTVMHFRIRVLDLIEIYVQHNPSLLVAIEIALSLYNMIEFCAEKDLQPLAVKVEKVLGKLTALRQFSDVEDVSEQNIVDYLRMIINAKLKTPAFDVHNKLRTKCCTFLIAASTKLDQKLANGGGVIYELLVEYIKEFIDSRNPAINITVLTDIFKMRWTGVWPLAIVLCEKGLKPKTRGFRRIQIMELIDHLYKNHELIKQSGISADPNFKSIEQQLEKHIQTLTTKEQISLKEFTTILNLILTANRCRTKFEMQISFNQAELCENIQKIRKKVKLDVAQSYTRFCKLFNLTIIKNCDVVKTNGKILENGTYEIESSSSEVEIVTSDEKPKKEKTQTPHLVENGNSKQKKVKRKRDDGAFKKEKKLRKEMRLKTSSEGLNGGYSFVGAPIDVDMSDGSADHDSD